MRMTQTKRKPKREKQRDREGKSRRNTEVAIDDAKRTKLCHTK